MDNLHTIAALEARARAIRVDIVKSLHQAGSGHLGASLGMADVFTFLYFKELNHRPQQPTWKNRDRLVLSIGHIAPVLYASLAHAGYFPTEELQYLRKMGSRLQGHPSLDSGLPGLELSSGSLGQGLSIAVGLALACKLDQAAWLVYCVLGDGELQEGSVWEAAMSAAHHSLDRLVAIVDRNQCQIDGKTEEVMQLEPLGDKWRAFGWQVIDCDGHDFQALSAAFQAIRPASGKPSVVLCHTTMGKGVKSIENDYRWHGKVPDDKQLAQFLQELGTDSIPEDSSINHRYGE